MVSGTRSENPTASFEVRQLIVPPNGAVIEEAVATWQSSPSAPISFEVTVPPRHSRRRHHLHPIQPLWLDRTHPHVVGRQQCLEISHSTGRWTCTSIFYRYCRNGQCGVADDEATAGDSATGHQVGTAITGQDLRDSVTRWAWMSSNGPTTLVGSNVIARAAVHS